MRRRLTRALAGLLLLLSACSGGSNGDADAAAKRPAETPEAVAGGQAVDAPDPAPAPATSSPLPAPPTPAHKPAAPTPTVRGLLASNTTATTTLASEPPAPTAGPQPPPVATTGASTRPTSAPARQNELPDAVVRDVKTGEYVNVRSLTPADKPILFWFYAPNCPSCNREAPGLEQFARKNADAFQTVGLGTQDRYEGAKLFAIRYSITFRMLWDGSFKSWQGFGISNQPAYILVTREGAKVKKWQGELSQEDKEEIVRLARES